MKTRRDARRKRLQQKYTGKLHAIENQENTEINQKKHEFWNKARIAMLTLTVAAMTWIVSESSRLLIDRNIPLQYQTSMTSGMIVLIVVFILVAANFDVHDSIKT